MTTSESATSSRPSGLRSASLVSPRSFISASTVTYAAIAKKVSAMRLTACEMVGHCGEHEIRLLKQVLHVRAGEPVVHAAPLLARLHQTTGPQTREVARHVALAQPRERYELPDGAFALAERL